MGRRRNVLPAEATGRQSLANLLDRLADTVTEVSNSLRRPAAQLVDGGCLRDVKISLLENAQKLQDISVEVACGVAKVHAAETGAPEPSLPFQPAEAATAVN